ncbi:MAG: winged helix-turn-helix transcriptional regulator [Oscillospiraceae bacterium]
MTTREMIAELAEQTAKMKKISKDYEVISIFQTKWHGRVLFELLLKSPRRFGELKREVPGISNAVLTSVLRGLEERELITRKQFNEIPPHVEYALTEQGRGMLPIFYEMIRWEKKYLPDCEQS